MIHLLTYPSVAGVWLRMVVIMVITLSAISASWMLMLPASYLPNGNKNFTFGLMFNPPGYSVGQNTSVAERLEASVQPYWEAADSQQATAIAPLMDMQSGKPIAKVPALDEFFFVVSRGRVFMITTSKDPENVRPGQSHSDTGYEQDSRQLRVRFAAIHFWSQCRRLELGRGRGGRARPGLSPTQCRLLARAADGSVFEIRRAQ